MTTYYVDWEKADNTGNGLTLATAKKTLNGAEDIPVAAGDFVWVRPGVYREMLTVDVSGSNGSPITYQGDVAGQIWHPGGVVRITGSDDDQTATRTNCIRAGAGKSYRTYRGFQCDSTTQGCILHFGVSNTNITIEDCTFTNIGSPGCIDIDDTTSNFIVRRCLFIQGFGTSMYIFSSSTLDDSNHLVENCIFVGRGNYSLIIQRVGGINIRNCYFQGGGIQIQIALSAGQVNNVNNCIFRHSNTALNSATLGQLVEDYNTISSASTPRSNVDVGANSVSYPPLTSFPLLLGGYRLSWQFGDLSHQSLVARRTDNGSTPADDFFGLTRPVTNGKRSWGPIQFTGAVREITITDGGGASLKLPDAGEQFFMRVPTSASEITIAVKVYREADYAGTLPQLVVRQPGQADETDTDTGDAEEWNTLSVTFTPDALPPWVDVFIRSNNTAAADDYATYWDTLTVT